MLLKDPDLCSLVNSKVEPHVGNDSNNTGEPSLVQSRGSFLCAGLEGRTVGRDSSWCQIVTFLGTEV